MSLKDLKKDKDFINRHIGPRENEIISMLGTISCSSLDDLAHKVIPKSIQSQHQLFFTPQDEQQTLQQLKSIMSQNKVRHSLIGMGFYDTFTPPVILRNILENPAWYTAYTPYQAEISQGRMEALLNFQTMITDLTGMEITNSSLLDEGTAVAEAVVMAHNLTPKSKCQAVFVSDECHPHVIEVLQTRARALKIELLIGKEMEFDFSTDVFAILLQYPQSSGAILDYSELTKRAHSHGALVIANVDLLSLTLLTPPGEWDADIVTGNSQRFGVPLGFGGPHAAFLATRDKNKRLMPGRLIGVSIDADNNRALRLALQTREQHIRREKATSNICTAQVLLANMASMYAVYHGPSGLKDIASRIHALTQITKIALTKLGYRIAANPFFDTLTVSVRKEDYDEIAKNTEINGINLRLFKDQAFGISINETTNLSTINALIKSFNKNKDVVLDTSPLEKFNISFPDGLSRKSTFLSHPIFNSHHSETQLLRYIHHLQNKDLSLTFSMIPLGSCTMKLNGTTELLPISWPEVNGIHPFAPLKQATGYLQMINDLESKLCDITGFAGVSLQPNAGSQGEFAGLLVIRKFHESRDQGHRDICLIPSSAHGTNPASAAMAGMKVVVVQCDNQGNVDVTDLQNKATEYSNNLAALMITYPSTHGVFEENIVEICQLIHKCGGQVYMDGANLNALVGLCRPGEFGPDVAHMNLHKTFAIPHGGGGPGVGPIGVKAHLKPFLPQMKLVPESGPETGTTSVTSAPWGSASILPISWSYITMMGGEGLKKASLVAILSANYIAKKLENHYPVLYKGRNGFVAHECIIDLREIKKQTGIDVTDVAKRLMDYGFHAPTMSWPVAGTLMIEPTESESKAELDRFIEAMISIRHEIEDVGSGKLDQKDNPLTQAPHTLAMVTATNWNHSYSREQAAYPLSWLRDHKFWPSVRRVDNVFGDKNIMCSCPPIEAYHTSGLE
jgi:glycine dehydrogenase